MLYIFKKVGAYLHYLIFLRPNYNISLHNKIFSFLISSNLICVLVINNEYKVRYKYQGNRLIVK